MGSKKGIDDVRQEDGIELLTHEYRPKEGRSCQLGDCSLDVKGFVQIPGRHRVLQNILQRFKPASNHVSVWAADVATQPRAFYRNRHETCAAPSPDTVTHMGEDHYQVGARVAGQRNWRLRFLKSNGVAKKILTIGPMSIDCRSGYPRGLADSECGDRLCPFFDKKLPGRLENDRPGPGHTGITASMTPATTMPAMS